jgi:adenylate cyclase
MAFPLPEKPSIAVLPFANMSDDPGKEFLSDGITEQIITSLSKVPSLFVISRTSTFSYKDKPAKVQQVAEELGVRYVLEGSVQQSEDKIRITAQLIDALTGRHLWAQRYERNYEDIFALQDEITLKVLNEMQVKLTEGERLRAFTGKTTNLEAYEKMLESITYVRAFNIESNATARRLLEEVIALDPVFSRGYSYLAGVNLMDVWLGSSKSPPKSLAQATELLQKAIDLDENNDEAYSLLCGLYAMQRQFDKSIEAGQKAIELNPNSAGAYVWLAMPLRYMGKAEEAIEFNKKAIRLCPFPPSYYYLNLGHAYRTANRCEEAITEYKKALHLTPQNAMVFEGLSICYGFLGKEQESRAAAAEIIKLNPNYTIKSAKKSKPYLNRELFERWLNALRKAGIPEG